MTYNSSLERAGGGVVQPAKSDEKPEDLKRHMLAANSEGYRAQAIADGIPLRYIVILLRHSML